MYARSRCSWFLEITTAEMRPWAGSLSFCHSLHPERLWARILCNLETWASPFVVAVLRAPTTRCRGPGRNSTAWRLAAISSTRMKVCSLKRKAVGLAVTVTSATSSLNPTSTPSTPVPSPISGNAGPGSFRTFTVRNNCPFTIWCGWRPRPYEEPADKSHRPALYTDPNARKSVPSQPTGWEQASGATVTFTVPHDWTAGRIWGRTECNFSVNSGPNSCVTGGCNGGFLCDTGTGTARIRLDLDLFG